MCVCVIFLLAFVFVTPAKATNDYSFTTIDYPGAIGISATGINNAGQIVGTFVLRLGCLRCVSGFVYSGGSFTTILQFPGDFATNVRGINDAGQIVGAYESCCGLPAHGFLFSEGSFSTIEPPGAQASTAYGINNAGQIVGSYLALDGTYHGFLLSNASFTTIDFPGASQTVPQGINDAGQIVGYYRTGGVDHSFLLSGGSFSTIEFPGASTTVYGINNAGQIVGNYVLDGSHGFLATPINHPPTANAGGPYTVAEGATLATLTGSGSDPDGDPLTYSWDLDNNGTFETPGQNPSFSAAGRDGPSSQTVVLRVCDSHGACATSTATVNITNVAPTVGTISAPVAPVQVNTAITSSATFTDPGTSDTHTAVWSWGDGTTSAGTVTETNGSGSVTGSHTYIAAGVHTVTLTVTDDDGGSGQSVFQFVVVFDPSVGFVTGGGWINSPAGAYAADPSLTGKANFGFVSRYRPGATVPEGQTEFRFSVANLNFHSSNYEWLVVGGARAQYKGTGTINGAGSYSFILTAIDGQVSGGGGVDKFRIKIWGSGVIYDNQTGASDTADPTTQLEGGSIVIHTR